MRNQILPIIVLLLSCIMTPFFGKGQKILLEKKTTELYKDALKRGPNLRHYHHLYINYGMSLGKSEGDGCEVKPLYTPTFATGLRYKLRLSNAFAIGYNLQFSLYSYRLKQDSLKKLIPNNKTHKKERLRFNNLGAEVYFRLNVDKRGNFVGRFVDVGFYCDRAIRVKHIYYKETDNKTNPDKADVVKITNGKLNYYSKFNYGVRTRFGVNRYVISAGYRLSDIFNKEFHNDEIDAELPRFYMAIEIGLHK